MGSGIGPCELSEKEVKIIKESWKIPMEHVRNYKIVMNDDANFRSNVI